MSNKIIVVAMSVLFAGCSSAMAGSAPSAQPAAKSAAEVEALYNARRDSAKLRFTDADVRFMTNMIHHHAQAIEMSRLAPTRSSSASIRTLAARIINSQQDEIAIMQTWLRDRKQAAPLVDSMGVMPGMSAMPGMDHGDHAVAQMPGMVPAAQMQQLRSSQGAAFDRMFLTLMIGHHKGAVTMVNELFATDGAGQDEAVFKFASDVQADQTTEVSRMERMLAAMPATPQPQQRNQP